MGLSLAAVYLFTTAR